MTTTTVKTLAQFVEASHLDAGLVRAVVKQFGGWASFKESAPDVTRHGIDGGFHGFIYTVDTNKFAHDNRAAISALASQQAEEFGTGVFEMFRNFGCFRNGTKPTDEELGSALYAGRHIDNGLDVLNAMAWYVGEEVCRSYCDLTGND